MNVSLHKYELFIARVYQQCTKPIELIDVTVVTNLVHASNFVQEWMNLFTSNLGCYDTYQLNTGHTIPLGLSDLN